VELKLTYRPKHKRIITKEEIIQMFGEEDKQLNALADRATLTLYDPDTPTDIVIKSLEIVLSDLKLKRELERLSQKDLSAEAEA